jgi:hypothetical protein
MMASSSDRQRLSPGSLAAQWKGRGFPVEDLSAYPITAIEGLSAKIGFRYRGVCTRGCLGCSADAVNPSHAAASVHRLTTQLLKGILETAEGLAQSGFHVFSRERFNLYSGSNELDHPSCWELRQQLSAFFVGTYGLRLGAISSDLVFHVSPSELFRRNLTQAFEQPLLWDNICLAIDEQLPIRDKHEYDRYLDSLEWTWRALSPALRCELDHARAERCGQPRVIVNLLVPPDGAKFNKTHTFLYPGGPRRATSHDELARRYVMPFVGDLQNTDDPIPPEHIFTTSVGRLTRVPGSSVFISAAIYELVGRSETFLDCDRRDAPIRQHTETIRTKIFPAGRDRFVIRACRAENPVSDGELPWGKSDLPRWAASLENFVIRVGGPPELICGD